MKQNRILLSLMLLMTILGGMSSCCETQVNSASGFKFMFSDSVKIQKIDLIGTNKTLYFNTTFAQVTLNPADSISRYFIYCQGDSGEVDISYTTSITYRQNLCSKGDDLEASYDMKIKGTTFSQADFVQNLDENYVKIKR